MKKLLSVFLSVVILLSMISETNYSVFAEDLAVFEFNGFNYTIDDDAVTITGYIGTDDKLVIPETINDYPVTAIGENAFSANVFLTNVFISKNVTTVFANAFSDCSNLAIVFIPSGIQSIEANAFLGCSAINKVYFCNTSSVWTSARNNISSEGNSSILNNTVQFLYPNTTSSSGTLSGSSGYVGETVSYRTVASSGLISKKTIYIDGSGRVNENTVLPTTSLLTADIVIGPGITWMPDSFFENYSVPSVTVDSDNPAYVTVNDNVYDRKITKALYIGKNGEFTIPGTVESISTSVLGNATGLTEINVEAGNANFVAEDGVLFNKDKTILLRYPDDNERTTYIVPSTVVSIADKAFYSADNLTSVIIPDSVTSIGSDAFKGCTGLTSVTIPDSVTRIGSGAFSRCAGLTSIIIPDSIKSIGSDAFYGCTGLMSVIIPDSVTSIGTNAFQNCTGLTSVTIPDSVTSIGNYAFYDCSGLTSITIPDSVTSISIGAFRGCKGLTSITIPDSVTSIGNYAFYGCSGLTSVTIPDSVTNIGDSAFCSCEGLTSITIPDSVTSIGNYAFKGCTNLTNITIPNNVDTIGSSAFSGCTGLTGVSFGNGLTSIGSSAFSGCTSLTNITIPNNVTTIGSSAFSGCTGLTGVSFGNGLISIGSSAFSGCTSLTSINIPNNVSTLGAYAFFRCTELTNVTIGSGVSAIQKYTFQNCTKLKNVSLSNGLEEIGECAFYRCGNLSNIVIPDSVTTIGNYSFAGKLDMEDELVSGLTSVNFGNGVVNIGAGAFYYCTKLTSISIPNSVKKIGDYAFGKCESAKSISLGNSVEYIGEYAFYTSYICHNDITSITIPKSVKYIGKEAFSIRGLKNVYIKSYDCEFDNSSDDYLNNFEGYTIDGNSVSTNNITFYACPGSTTEQFVNNCGHNFYTFASHHDYIETGRTEPTFTINGETEYCCENCGQYHTEPNVLFRSDSDSTRFASNEYILPAAKSFVYNNKILTRFDKPIVNFKNIFSAYFKFPELQDEFVLSQCRTLTSDGTKNAYLIGGIKSNNNWIWQYSGDAVDLTNKWSSGEPNNSGGKENQIAINKSNGLYADYNVDSATPGFISCIDLEDINSHTKGSSYYKTNKYVFYNNTLPFSIAKLIAEVNGGYLATITSTEEQNTIHSLVGTSYKVFLGGAKNDDNNFVWLNGETLDAYSNWNSGEPSNYSATGGQFFIAMHTNGTWDDCNDLKASKEKETNGFVVEYEPTRLEMCIDQDENHGISDNEITITAYYPDNSSMDITDSCSFETNYLNSKCTVTANVTMPNGNNLQVENEVDLAGEHILTCERVEPTADFRGYIKYSCSICDYETIEYLDYLSDDAALTAVLNITDSIVPQDYSESSYNTLNSIINAYSSVAAGVNPQTEIDNAVAEILTAVNELEPYLNFKVTAKNGTVSSTTQESSLLYGTEVTLTAAADDGYEFKGWYENNVKRIFSDNAQYTFKITSNTNLTALFTPVNSVSLIFANSSGQIIKTVNKTADEWETVSVLSEIAPSVPYSYGKKNGSWSIPDNALTLLRSGESVVITPVYDELENVYIPEAPVATEAPALTMYYTYDAENAYGSFVMAVDVPQGCSVESVGQIFYRKKASEFNPQTYLLTLNNKNIVSKFESLNENLYVTNIKKFNSNYNWAARGYISYTDSSGKLKTVYSEQINVVNCERI